MLDQAVRTRISDFIGAEATPRARVLQDALRAEQNRLNARGMLMSGNAIRRYIEIGADELRVRSGIVRTAILNSHASMVGTLNAQTLEDLRQQIEEHMALQTTSVRGAVSAIAAISERALQNRNLTPIVEDELAARHRELLNRLDIDARFYVDDLQRRAAAGAPAANAAPPLVVFHGPVGAVQTGAYATAHVSLADPADRTRLVAALEGLVQALAQNAEIAAEEREQTTEVAREVIAAVITDRPNPRKIAGLLGGLAQGLQTVASLRGAWELVRDAAGIVGIPLP